MNLCVHMSALSQLNHLMYGHKIQYRDALKNIQGIRESDLTLDKFNGKDHRSKVNVTKLGNVI